MKTAISLLQAALHLQSHKKRVEGERERSYVKCNSYSLQQTINSCKVNYTSYQNIFKKKENEKKGKIYASEIKDKKFFRVIIGC